MAERNYWVMCDSNCRYPAMTKEQILAAITQAVENGEVRDVDTGFVTKIKEKNAGVDLTFWVGTTAQYNALAKKEENCMYILTDDETGKSLESAVAEMYEKHSETANYIIAETCSSGLLERKHKNGIIEYFDTQSFSQLDITQAIGGMYQSDPQTYYWLENRKPTFFNITVNGAWRYDASTDAFVGADGIMLKIGGYQQGDWGSASIWFCSALPQSGVNVECCMHTIFTESGK